MRQFLIFVRKEFYHIFRDPRTMLILLAMPIVQIILFGFAISTEIRNSRVAVLDPSKTMLTQQIIEKIDASEYFTIEQNVGAPEQIDELYRESKIDVALVFGTDFDNNRTVQIIADASDPNTATLVTNYATAIIQSVAPTTELVVIDASLMYNPSMLSSYNFVPGVMGMILMLICAMMTSISIVREKETGTMEVLLVSPVNPIRIILAKVVPYFVISAVDLILILLVSVFILGVPIAGSLVWLLLLSLVFIFVVLSLGLLISTLVTSQIAAMLVSGMVLMMPTVLLSGMMFPVDNMPLPLQLFSAILPARWFIEGVRKLMIQGVDVSFVIKEFVILGVMAVVLITVSLKKFKIRL